MICTKVCKRIHLLHLDLRVIQPLMTIYLQLMSEEQLIFLLSLDVSLELLWSGLDAVKFNKIPKSLLSNFYGNI